MLGVVHTVDRNSNKSALAPPSPRELERLAQQSRTLQPQPSPIEPAGIPVKSLRRRFSPHEIEDLLTRYNAGAALRALSLEYGVSRSGLRQLLQSKGVALRTQGITSDDAEEAVRLYERGPTIRQVAEQIGSSFGTIRNVLHRHGVSLRPSAIRKRKADE
jgi:lambda repressor-like predicted transcriptional regulator